MSSITPDASVKEMAQADKFRLLSGDPAATLFFDIEPDKHMLLLPTDSGGSIELPFDLSGENSNHSNSTGMAALSLAKQDESVLLQASQLQRSWSATQSALLEAAANRGRETNGFKMLHDFLTHLLNANLNAEIKEICWQVIRAHLNRIAHWDCPQWFSQIAGDKLPGAEKLLADTQSVHQSANQYETLWFKNGFSREQMRLWDDWIEAACQPFVDNAGSVEERILFLQQYLHRRVCVDSVKNWLRRRPSEPLVNGLFAAIAQDKIYIDEGAVVVRNYRDESGRVCPVEYRQSKLYFADSQEELPVCMDDRGRFLPLPADCDMVVFERRTIHGQRLVVPIAQPTMQAPNIQWFTNAAVKRGWEKERLFLLGPAIFADADLYGFFPDHYPMRITNSLEQRLPTEKTGAALYGYVRDHNGRQSRQLIVECGEVMPDLKKTNSQLISEARLIFGLKKR